MTINDNVIHSVMRNLAMLVAKFWTDYIRPMPFEAVFVLNGARVRISIEEYKRVDDTQPVRRVVDEDSSIED